MKKLIIALLCVSLVAGGMFVFTSCSKSEQEDTGNVESGGWAKSQSYEITDELKELFRKAEVDGATYTPIALLETQIVAGTNYKVLCKIETVTQEPTAKYAIVTLYANLDGGAEITSVVSCNAYAPAGSENLSGGWSDAYNENGFKLSDEANAAFTKATSALAGAEYTPVTCLATQVVAGMNYLIFCEAKPSTSGLDSSVYYTAIQIYADLQGNAEITETYDFTVVED